MSFTLVFYLLHFLRVCNAFQFVSFQKQANRAFQLTEYTSISRITRVEINDTTFVAEKGTTWEFEFLRNLQATI